LNDSNPFLGVASLHLLLRPSLVMKGTSIARSGLPAKCHVRKSACMLVTPREFAIE
jgi:hypothetical protein